MTRERLDAIEWVIIGWMVGTIIAIAVVAFVGGCAPPGERWRCGYEGGGLRCETTTETAR